MLPDVDVAWQFEVKVEVDVRQVYRGLHKRLADYKSDQKGATIVCIQSPMGLGFKEYYANITRYINKLVINIILFAHYLHNLKQNLMLKTSHNFKIDFRRTTYPNTNFTPSYKTRV